MKKLLLLMLFLASPAIAADNVWRIDWGSTSQFLPCRPIFADDGVSALTGLDGDDIDIAIKSDTESTWTDFTTSTNIEGGGTVGTYDTPTSNAYIVMDECETEGWYEFDLHNDYLVITNALEVMIRFTDAGGNLVAERIDIIDQNFVTPADIQSEAEDAVYATLRSGSGECEAGSSATTCVDTTSRTEADDFWNGAVACFVTGTYANQCRKIVDFVASSDTFTFDPPLAGAPAAGDDYNIWPGQYVWNEICESQDSLKCGDILAYTASILFGECDYNGSDTYTCQDPGGNTTRIVVTYGVDAGDRTGISLTPP